MKIDLIPGTNRFNLPPAPPEWLEMVKEYKELEDNPGEKHERWDRSRRREELQLKILHFFGQYFDLIHKPKKTPHAFGDDIPNPYDNRFKLRHYTKDMMPFMDHRRCWATPDGRKVVTNQPYDFGVDYPRYNEPDFAERITRAQAECESFARANNLYWAWSPEWSFHYPGLTILTLWVEQSPNLRVLRARQGRVSS